MSIHVSKEEMEGLDIGEWGLEAIQNLLLPVH